MSRLRELREAKKLTQEHMANFVNKSRPTYTRWEIGENEPDYDTLKKLAGFFGVSTDYLLGRTDNPTPVDIERALTSIGSVHGIEDFVKIPVYGVVRGGYNKPAAQKYEGYELAEVSSIKGNIGDYFWLRVTGNSMSPNIMDGDLVLIKKQNDVDSGDIAVIIIDGEDGTVKKIKKGKDYIALIPINPAYESLIFEKWEMNELYIVGRVIELKRKFRY